MRLKRRLVFSGSKPYIFRMDKLDKMTQEYFERGIEIDEYVRELRSYRSLVRKLMGEATAKQAHVEELKEKLKKYPQPVRATSHTEDWCGDWAANIGILNDLFDKAGVEFRVFNNAEHPELKKKYKQEGVGHIPVVSLWDAEGEEIARWVEAPRKVAAMKDEWKQENPRMMELFPKQKEDKQAAKEFAKLYRKFLEEMAVWYQEGMWDETTREIVQAVK